MNGASRSSLPSRSFRSWASQGLPSTTSGRRSPGQGAGGRRRRGSGRRARAGAHGFERQAAAQRFRRDPLEGLATPAFSITNTSATVTIGGQVDTSLLKVLHVPQIAVPPERRLKAFDGPPPCILALNRSVDKALLLTGGAQYLAEGA